MEVSFPRESDRYIVVQQSENEVLQEMAKLYKHKKWWKIAALFGIDKNCKVTGATVPRGHAYLKGKVFKPEDPKLRVVKGRPITPHTKHPWKRVSILDSTPEDGRQTGAYVPNE